MTAFNFDGANYLLGSMYARASRERDLKRQWPHCGLQQAIWDIKGVVQCLQVAFGGDPYGMLPEEPCDCCGQPLYGPDDFL